MLKKKKSERLGVNGDIDEVLAHPWFKGTDPEDILQKSIVPPFIPKIPDDDSIDPKAAKSLAETFIPPEAKDLVKS